jgi:endonuclease III
MTIKQLIKLEDKAKEVWVVSPNLHYDVSNADFSELVSVNLGQKTKYKYIVPATKEIIKNIDIYKNKYNMSEAEIQNNFLLLPESELNPFVMEIGIYDASTDCVACAAPSLEEGQEVIKFTAATAKEMAKSFKALWKKYKRTPI